MFVTAVTLSALLFGLGHLPGAFAMGMPRRFWPIALIVLVNALMGIFTGVLYGRLGLEHAMLAHFSIHIVIRGIWPLFMG